jgi:hypothetical protein
MCTTSHFDRAPARAVVLAVLGACGAAHAQFSSNFEPPYTGSATGTLLTNGFGLGGQQGWYNPVSGSADANVFTYAGNTLSISANPTGGTQFECGVAGGNLAFARAQHSVDFSAGGVWTAAWDCTGLYNGTLPAVDNIGSFSLQTSASSRYFQQLMSWGPTLNLAANGNAVTDWTATAEKFHIAWGFFSTATQAAAAPTFKIASTAWTDLPVNHWYHVTVKWDFAAAQILEVSIKDLTANGPTTTDNVTANNWFLFGGQNSVAPLPTDIRVFTGGGSGTSPPGNVAAWDNLDVAPFVAPPSCYANCDNSTTPPVLNVADFTCFLTKYAAGDPYANCDSSTTQPTLNVADFTCFLTKYAAGCSAP